jgi:hypothetical protein
MEEKPKGRGRKNEPKSKPSSSPRRTSFGAAKNDLCGMRTRDVGSVSCPSKDHDFRGITWFDIASTALP